MPYALCPNHSMDQRRNGLRFFRLDPVSGFHQMARFRQTGVGVVMQRTQRLAARHRVSDALMKFKAHGGVDRVFLLFPSAAEHHAGHAELLALNRGDISFR